MRSMHLRRANAAAEVLRMAEGGGDGDASNSKSNAKRVLIVGGTGRIGTAAAAHLVLRGKGSKLACDVVLGGRDPVKGGQAVDEVTQIAGGPAAVASGGCSVSYQQLDWTDQDSLKSALAGCDCVMHTAGPFFGQNAAVLRSAIECGVPCYVDVADPPDHIEASKALKDAAAKSKTCALICSGAFPGLSNVMAVEAAEMLGEPVKTLAFSYFTAGLGGSGPLNLYITNLGFGEEVETFRGGKLQRQRNAGQDARNVEFFIDEDDESYKRVGTVSTWAWPFPEGATVAKSLGITGDSRVAMGTAPDVWNVIMGLLVELVPRDLWKNEAFSLGMAKFSEPMVWVTDRFVGETHCIRVDVAGESGKRVTAVQAHDSFRWCVGQSSAEFALDIMGGASARAGVHLPEELYSLEDSSARKRILGSISSAKGTFTYRYKLVEKS